MTEIIGGIFGGIEILISQVSALQSNALIDSILKSSVNGIKWIIYTETLTKDRTSVREILAVYRGIDDNLSHNEYGILGDTFDVDFNVIVSSSVVQLIITNNESETINIRAARILL